MTDLEDGLARARADHAAAIARGDAAGAAVIARAIEVLEQAVDGTIPRQRSSPDNATDDGEVTHPSP